MHQKFKKDSYAWVNTTSAQILHHFKSVRLVCRTLTGTGNILCELANSGEYNMFKEEDLISYTTNQSLKEA